MARKTRSQRRAAAAARAAEATECHRLEGELAKQRDVELRDEERWRRRKDRIKQTAERQQAHEDSQVRQVYVGNLQYSVDETELRERMSEFGMMAQVSIPPGPSPGRNKGFAFVTFSEPEMCGLAIARAKQGSGISVNGRRIIVRPSPPKPGQRRPVIPSDMFEVFTLQVGPGKRPTSPTEFLCAWEHQSNETKLRVQGSSRRLCCYFRLDGRLLRFQLYMKDVIGDIEVQELKNEQTALLLTMRRPPKLFRLDEPRGSYVGDAVYNAEEKFWIRTTDPTGTSAMGQFLSYRLVLCHAHWTARMRKLISSLSQYHLLLDPCHILLPHLPVVRQLRDQSEIVIEARSQLDFPVRYEMEVLRTFGALHEHELTADFCLHLGSMAPAQSVRVLRQLIGQSDHTSFTSDLAEAATASWRVATTLNAGNAQAVSDVHVEVFRAVVTPLRVLVLPPELEVSNRMLRTVDPTRLMRVSFADENLSALSQAQQTLSEDVCNRISMCLSDGLIVGGRFFEFLAFSSSQLKHHGVWFVATNEQTGTADEIRARMGAFSHIKIAGKYAARMGQCFSTTSVGSSIAERDWQHIPDIRRNGFCFSDGAGTISPELLAEVAGTLLFDPIPSALQIRLGGAKGVLTLDPTLIGRKLCTRPSMEKFESDARQLEVCNPAVFASCYLNRQLITLLSTLGVPDQAFIDLQESMLREADAMLCNKAAARAALHRLGEPRDSAIATALRMLDTGLPLDEVYMRQVLQAVHFHVLDQLKVKTRIHVPEGALLMGVLDETARLRCA